MIDRAKEKLATAKHAASKLGQAAEVADGYFVSWAGQVEKAVLGTAAGVCTKAAGIVPHLSHSTAHVFYEFGQRSEARARESDSLVITSVPAAAYRTAGIVNLLGEKLRQVAIDTVESLLGPPTPPSQKTEERLRLMGVEVAAFVNRGLDAFCVGLSLRARVDELREMRTTRSLRQRPTTARPREPRGQR